MKVKALSVSEIRLSHLQPVFLEERRIKNSEVWNKNIRISRGEYVQVIAPSGSGKTSLIHFLYGLSDQYSGQIFFDNKEIKNFTSEQIAELRQYSLSVIFQDLQLFDNLTLHENIEIKRVLNPHHPKEKVQEMAEKLGIAHRLHQKASICSRGEKQRAAIIRALMQPFDFLLADEPFSHLDNKNSHLAYELIHEECKNRKASFIIATLNEEQLMPSGIKLLL